MGQDADLNFSTIEEANRARDAEILTTSEIEHRLQSDRSGDGYDRGTVQFEAWERRAKRKMASSKIRIQKINCWIKEEKRRLAANGSHAEAIEALKNAAFLVCDMLKVAKQKELSQAEEIERLRRSVVSGRVPS